MEETGHTPKLFPAPADLVALAAALVDCSWSESEEQREALFRELELESGGEFERRPSDSGSRSFGLATALPGNIFGAWASYKGNFMGINLQPYSAVEPNAPAARRAHDEIQGRLTDLYGAPTRPWDDQEVPPSIWKVNGRDIVMHFFHGQHSGVMLSIDGSELAAAAEAEAVARADRDLER